MTLQKCIDDSKLKTQLLKVANESNNVGGLTKWRASVEAIAELKINI